MKEKLSLVFFGSGPVAAESLRLLSQEFVIEAVVTKATTKQEMLAICPDAPLYTVSDKSELDDIFTTQEFTSIVGVLIDFGIIVSTKVIDYFPKGIVNSHFSLLPDMRGADPISFAILEGRDKTGVSLMLLVEAMDEGPLIAFGEEPLHGKEKTPELTKNLIQLSYSLLQATLPAYVFDQPNPATGSVPIPRSQREVCEAMNKPYEPSYTRKLTKQDNVIDWNKSAEVLEREIRAFYEWPKSRTTLGSIECILTEASVLDKTGEAGELFLHDQKLAVYCGEGALVVERIKPASKADMTSEAFLAGYRARLKL